MAGMQPHSHSLTHTPPWDEEEDEEDHKEEQL